MNIAVCVKQVPDTAEIKWTENNTIDRNGLESVINLECPKCHNTFDTTFRYTEEFFRPHID